MYLDKRKSEKWEKHYRVGLDDRITCQIWPGLHNKMLTAHENLVLGWNNWRQKQWLKTSFIPMKKCISIVENIINAKLFSYLCTISFVLNIIFHMTLECHKRKFLQIQWHGIYACHHRQTNVRMLGQLVFFCLFPSRLRANKVRLCPHYTLPCCEIAWEAASVVSRA